MNDDRQTNDLKESSPRKGETWLTSSTLQPRKIGFDSQRFQILLSKRGFDSIKSCPTTVKEALHQSGLAPLLVNETSTTDRNSQFRVATMTSRKTKAKMRSLLDRYGAWSNESTIGSTGHPDLWNNSSTEMNVLRRLANERAKRKRDSAHSSPISKTPRTAYGERMAKETSFEEARVKGTVHANSGTTSLSRPEDGQRDGEDVGKYHTLQTGDVVVRGASVKSCESQSDAFRLDQVMAPLQDSPTRVTHNSQVGSEGKGNSKEVWAQYYVGEVQIPMGSTGYTREEVSSKRTRTPSKIEACQHPSVQCGLSSGSPEPFSDLMEMGRSFTWNDEAQTSGPRWSLKEPLSFPPFGLRHYPVDKCQEGSAKNMFLIHLSFLLDCTPSSRTTVSNETSRETDARPEPASSSPTRLKIDLRNNTISDARLSNQQVFPEDDQRTPWQYRFGLVAWLILLLGFVSRGLCRVPRTLLRQPVNEMQYRNPFFDYNSTHQNDMEESVMSEYKSEDSSLRVSCCTTRLVILEEMLHDSAPKPLDKRILTVERTTTLSQQAEPNASRHYVENPKSSKTTRFLNRQTPDGIINKDDGYQHEDAEKRGIHQSSFEKYRPINLTNSPSQMILVDKYSPQKFITTKNRQDGLSPQVRQSDGMEKPLTKIFRGLRLQVRRLFSTFKKIFSRFDAEPIQLWG